MKKRTASKKTEPEPVKGPWKVHAIHLKSNPSKKAFEAFGVEIERTLNSIEDSSHQIQQMRIDGAGLMVLTRENEPHPLAALILGNRGRVTPVKYTGQNTDRLIQIVFHSVSPEASDEEKKSYIGAIVNDVMGKVEAEEIRKTVTDCENFIENHQQTHGDEDCGAVSVMKIVQSVLTEKLQLQLQ